MSTTVTDSARTAAAGYRPGRTLSFWTEVRRQAARRRTQFALGFMVLLPLIVLGAFEWNPGGDGDDDGDGGGGFSALVDVATVRRRRTSRCSRCSCRPASC